MAVTTNTIFFGFRAGRHCFFLLVAVVTPVVRTFCGRTLRLASATSVVRACHAVLVFGEGELVTRVAWAREL